MTEYIKRMLCHCLKCTHKWISRTEGRPAVCPACNNARWDVGPKIEGMGKPKKEKEEVDR